MKRYNELNDQEQEQAVEKSLTSLLTVIIEGAIRFDDVKNGDDLQARIDRALEKADEMRTPWFAGEYILDAVGEELREMAQVDAEEAYYSEPYEVCYSGIIHKAA